MLSIFVCVFFYLCWSLVCHQPLQTRRGCHGVTHWLQHAFQAMGCLLWLVFAPTTQSTGQRSLRRRSSVACSSLRSPLSVLPVLLLCYLHDMRCASISAMAHTWEKTLSSERDVKPCPSRKGGGVEITAHCAALSNVSETNLCCIVMLMYEFLQWYLLLLISPLHI